MFWSKLILGDDVDVIFTTFVPSAFIVPKLKIPASPPFGNHSAAH